MLACAFASLVLLCAACTGHTDPDSDPAALACDEVDEVGTPIMAADVADATAPTVAIGAEPYRVTLPASGTGYVRVETVAEETAAIGLFQLSGALVRVLEADATTELAVTSAGAVAACPALIPEHFDLDFDGPGVRYFELTSAEPVWMLLADAEGHGHE
jgi:hypothetical protein